MLPSPNASAPASQGELLFSIVGAEVQLDTSFIAFAVSIYDLSPIFESIFEMLTFR